MAVPVGLASVDQVVPPFVDDWMTAPVDVPDGFAHVSTTSGPTRFAVSPDGSARVDTTYPDHASVVDQSMLLRGPSPAKTR